MLGTEQNYYVAEVEYREGEEEEEEEEEEVSLKQCTMNAVDIRICQYILATIYSRQLRQIFGR